MDRSLTRRGVTAAALAVGVLPISAAGTASAYGDAPLASTVAPLVTPAPAISRSVMSLRGRDNGARADRLLLRGANYTRGATINLFRTGPRYQPREFVKQATSNEFGNVRFVVRDLNGDARTQYRAYMRPSEGEFAQAVSNRRVVR